MAPLMLLLQLLLLVSNASAYYYYRYYGGSVTFSPKRQYSNGTYEVELRTKQAHYHCYHNTPVCSSGDCGTVTHTSSASISYNYCSYYWCQNEAVTTRKLSSNRPFEIRYPMYFNYYYAGYWISNTGGSYVVWTMTAHVDLGTRSDTGESNRSPVTAMPGLIRVSRHCPRTFNLPVFDPDADRVRCRYAAPTPYECSLCYQPAGFSLDQEG
ncbi:uncharacterized protein LOC115357248 [Myripristis murdjan]|uniref:uncharacterized protein LOC115357248 n=1 Tax=Myripristis murdjan TaxID=586833 RepID=UPI001176372D|nr:uncharacterized protein LOC115357248 [Myripristis murdjan]